jgi:molybdopterin-synthase adenylyltransferase
MSLVVPETLWARLRDTLRSDGVETACIGLANRVGEGPATRFLLSELQIPERAAYQKQGPLEAELSPAFVASVVATARERRMSLVFIHTHPFADDPVFSEVDDAGERVLLDFAERRIPGVPHLALVIGTIGANARLLGSKQHLDVGVIGPTVKRFGLRSGDTIAPEHDGSVDVFDRQIRAFGVDAQRRLAELRIGIVGLGGTGSIAAEQLAHLGVTRFLLLDPDIVERSNLNRVVGASSRDVGQPKVDVTKALIQRIRPTALVEAQQASILRSSVLQDLRNVDAIFCCTDSHGSRYLLNELAYRFLIPCFDCGVAIRTNGHQVTHVSARVQMLAPGLSCLTCTNVLDPEQIRRDLLTDFERARDPYIEGGTAPEPAVLSLNGVAVSLLTTMFLGAFAGMSVSTRHQRYDAIRGQVRTIDTTPVEHCVTCSSSGGLASGDAWSLPGRPE